MRTLRFPLVTLAVILLVTSFVSTSRESKVPDDVIHRPTAVPDRLILNVTADPATSQALTWRTDTAVEKAVAEIAESEDGPAYPKKAVVLKARTEKYKTDINEAHFHSVVFTNLKPDTVYAYRAGDGHNWSEWNQFRTASAKPAPLTFAYVGDAQNDIFSMWSRVIRSAFSDAPRMHFIIHAGDLINRHDRDAEWGGWHMAAGWINRSIPSLPSPGNHEYGNRDEQGKRIVSGHWRPQFTLPGNGLAGLEETNYYLDIQGVRMVSLDSNVRQTEQAEWLDQLLVNNPNTWTIATFHHPIFSSSRGRDNKELRELWQPVFDKHSVDLVLTGHDHTYARTNLVTGIATRSPKGGTVYVVSVSGPKQYKLERTQQMERAAQDTQLYQIVRVDRDKLSYEARTGRGVLYDAFELRKERGRPNKMINRVPATPERRGTEETLPSGGQ
jgi:3',5'-cyclic AMP phosphodiesterase CpdA